VHRRKRLTMVLLWLRLGLSAALHIGDPRSSWQLRNSLVPDWMAAGAKLPPLADEMKPPRDPAAQQRGIFGKAKRLAVRVLP
jgi:hypothetical protein